MLFPGIHLLNGLSHSFLLIHWFLKFRFSWILLKSKSWIRTWEKRFSTLCFYYLGIDWSNLGSKTSLSCFKIYHLRTLYGRLKNLGWRCRERGRHILWFIIAHFNLTYCTTSFKKLLLGLDRGHLTNKKTYRKFHLFIVIHDFHQLRFHEFKILLQLSKILFILTFCRYRRSVFFKINSESLLHFLRWFRLTLIMIRTIFFFQYFFIHSVNNLRIEDIFFVDFLHFCPDIVAHLITDYFQIWPNSFGSYNSNLLYFLRSSFMIALHYLRSIIGTYISGVCLATKLKS